MATPRLAGLLASHLANSTAAFTQAADSLRNAAAVLRTEPIAGLDSEELDMFAHVIGANRGGIERMAKRVERLLSSPRNPETPANG